MRFVVVFVFILIAGNAVAQSYTKAGIRGLRLRNSGEVIHNNQVTGYYLFYNLERSSSRLNNFLLTVLDENLTEINSVTITRPPSFGILEASYNGSHFAVLGFDEVNESIEIIGFDNTLKQTGVLLRMVGGYNMGIYGAAANGDETEQRFIVPVNNKGFLLYSVTEERKVHFKIEFLTNDMTSVWVDHAAKDDMIAVAFEGFQNSQYIGSLIERRKKPSSKDLEFDLLVNRTDNGERVLRIPIVGKNYNIMVSDIQHDTVNGDFIVFGEYYPNGAKEVRDKSLGFMSVVYDGTGKVIAEQVNSWADLSKATPLDDKGKFEGSNTHILFHNTVRTADGQVFVIGEQYRKAASAGGIALTVAAIALGGGVASSMTQINIYNMVVFQFNPDFTINKVHVFEKNKSVMQLPAGALETSPKLVSNYAKAVGAFDYRFTQMSQDQSSFIIAYVDYDRTKQGGNAFVVGSIVYTPEKTFVTDKFSIQKRSTEFAIMKAKPGYLLVSEYFRKEKKLENRLEKVNY